MANVRNYKKRDRKFNDKDKSDVKSDRHSPKNSRANDPNWYAINDQLLRDTASFSYGTALGAPVTIAAYDNSTGTQSLTPFTWQMPGIMNIYTVPSVGESLFGDEAVNIAMRNIYSFVRHQNSGHTNYDAPDLMMYLLAMDSIYSFIGWMQRIYGIARVYSQTNRYLGNLLVSSQSVNWDNIAQNLADFRAYINMYITKASSFCIPNVMSYYSRHMWMYTQVFRDEDIAKSGLYMYTPAYLLQYQELNGAGYLNPFSVCGTWDSANSKIIPVHATGSQLSYLNIRTIGDTLLKPIVASEDLNIMSGDILKAYGRENLWGMAMIPDDYMTVPVYSDEVLYQIHNTTFAGNKPRTGTFNASTNVLTPGALGIAGMRIDQLTGIGDGRLISFHLFDDCPEVAYYKILDFYKESPTPQDAITATRNMLGGTYIGDTTNTKMFRIVSCGSEICLFAEVLYTDPSNTNGYDFIVVYGDHPNFTYQERGTIDKFNFCPHYFSVGYNTSGYSVSALGGIGGDFGTFATLDLMDVQNLHNGALLSEFGVSFSGMTK